jgi:hypothetical protein
MRRTSVAFLPLFLVNVPIADADSASGRIWAQSSFLRAHSITGFLDEAAHEGWQMPWVRSAWALARVEDEAEKKSGEAVLELALAFSASLDRIGPTCRGLPEYMEATADLSRQVRATWHDRRLSAEDVDAAITLSRYLFRLADWFAQEPGYGNLVLARRAMDLAVLPAARVLADDSISYERLAWLEAALAPAWGEPEFAARMLNREIAPGQFDPKGDRDALRERWQQGRLQSSDSRDHHWVERLAALAPEFGRAARASRGAPFPNESLEIVRYQDVLKSATTSVWLRSAYYEPFTDSATSYAVYRLRPLLIFRRELGEFPRFEIAGAITPGLRGAFDHVWTNHIGSGSGVGSRDANIGRAAYEVLDMIRRDQFVDQDFGATHNTGFRGPPSSAR